MAAKDGRHLQTLAAVQGVMLHQRKPRGSPADCGPVDDPRGPAGPRSAQPIRTAKIAPDPRPYDDEPLGHLGIGQPAGTRREIQEWVGGRDVRVASLRSSSQEPGTGPTPEGYRECQL